MHTEVGHRTIGARVNGRLVPLESTLDNGDVVEVFTSKAPNAGPSRDWLGFVKSPRARSKIRQWFTKERREEAIEQGKEQIAKLMRKEGLPLKRLLSHESLTRRRRTSSSPTSPRSTPRSARATSAPRPSYAGSSTCTAATRGRRRTSPRASRSPAAAAAARRRRRRRRRRRQGRRRRLGQARQVLHARCRRDDDPRLRHQGRRGVGAPHATAPTPASLPSQPERLLEVEWAPTAQSTFLVNIQVEALDRARLLSDVTMVLSDAHVNILSATLTTTRDRVAKSRFTFEMADAKHLDGVLRAVRGVPGVFDAYRVTQ